MARSSGSRSSSPSNPSATSTARSSASTVQPPKTQQNQVAPSRGLGLGSMLLGGMAMGAGAEFMRQLFSNPTVGGYMMPLIFSGLTAYGSKRFLFPNHPKKGIFTAAVFAGTFIFTKSTIFKEQNH
jgi:hypothetical protein